MYLFRHREGAATVFPRLDEIFSGAWKFLRRLSTHFPNASGRWASGRLLTSVRIPSPRSAASRAGSPRWRQRKTCLRSIINQAGALFPPRALSEYPTLRDTSPMRRHHTGDASNEDTRSIINQEGPRDHPCCGAVRLPGTASELR